MAELPVLYIPHGGGPCFFMDWTMGPPDTWHRMAEWLRHVPDLVGATPKAVLVISGHWEEEPVAVFLQAASGRKPPAQIRNQHSNSKAICSGAVVPAPCFRAWKVVGQFPGWGPSALSSSESACDAHPATE